MHSAEGQILHAGGPECKKRLQAWVQKMSAGLKAKNAFWPGCNNCIRDTGNNLNVTGNRPVTGRGMTGVVTGVCIQERSLPLYLLM